MSVDGKEQWIENRAYELVDVRQRKHPHLSYNEIDEFISFLNKYSSNSTIILATSKDIGKPGPLIDKLIYEKSNSLHCPLVIINGNLNDKDIEKII